MSLKVLFGSLVCNHPQLPFIGGDSVPETFSDSRYGVIPGYRLPILIVSLKRHLFSGMHPFPAQITHSPEAREYIYIHIYINVCIHELAGKPLTCKRVKFNSFNTWHTKRTISAKATIFWPKPSTEYQIGPPPSKYQNIWSVKLTPPGVYPEQAKTRYKHLI